MGDKWSKYEVKDWSKYEVKDESDNLPGQSESTGLSGIGTDILDLFGRAVSGATNLPETLGKSGQYIEENPAESMLHNLGQVAAGVGDVGKGLVNSGSDITDYLLKKKLHPAQLFTGDNGAKINNEISTSDEIGQSLAKNYGTSFHKELANQLIKSVTSNLPKISEDTGIEKALRLEPKPESGDTLFRNIPEAATLGAGVVGLGKAGIKVAKKGSDLLNKPAVKLTEAQHAENTLKSALDAAKTETGEAQLNAANKLSEQKNNLMQTHQEKAAEAESMLPNEPESVIKSQTVNHFSQVRDQLKQHFDKQYNDYRAGPGSNPVLEPLSPQELAPALEVLNPAGRRMGESLVPGEVELNIINPETKKPFVLNIPASNGTVQDYIEMMRTARDARSKLNRDIDKPHVTRADELQMSRESNTLKSLEDTVTKKIKDSVTPQEWEQFQGIQKDYKDLYRPFMDNKHLFDTWFNKKDSGQIFKELKQPAYSRLFNSLHDDPTFNQLALSEALRGKIHPLNDSNPVTQSKKIDELLAPHNADVNRFMSPEQFESLKSLSTFGHLIGDADKSLQALSKSLLSKATKASELAKATKLNPEAEKLLSDIESKQLSQKEINKRMKSAGIDTAEAKATFEARQHANQMLKKALSISSVHKILTMF